MALRIPHGPGVPELIWRRLFHSLAVANTIPLAGTWQPVHYVGRGGFGYVVLFARFDVINHVQEPGSNDRDGHRDYSAGFSRHESSETLIHSKLAATGSQAIVGFVGKSPVEQKHWRFRLYMEFCHHGNLHELIKYYRNPYNFPYKNTTVNARGVAMAEINIPELFIIRVMLSLMEAALVMRSGTAAANGAADPNWKEVLHRDIKTNNIFLQEPDQGLRDHWKLYPVPKLGDFGIAVETTDEDPNNSRTFQGIGTPGWFPPEQWPWFSTATRSYSDYSKMDSKLNVFAIGLVCYCLQYRILDPTIDFMDGARVQEPNDDDKDPGGALFNTPGYSLVLEDLIFECLSFDPARRPTLEEIRARLQPKGLDPDNVLYHGMRKITPKNNPWHSEFQKGGKHRLQGDFVDDYRVGLNRTVLPAVVDP